MSTRHVALDPETLLAHSHWVRSLARSMLPGDPHLADDVAQDACLTALARAPREDRPVRAWLATVVRNLVRQERRGSGRRVARERSVARDEALPATVDLVEKLSIHRLVVDAVTHLEEPYRTVILLRYFEELTPAAIARQQGVPVATVKTRLARAIDKLRSELDAHHGGDGRTWLLALIPLTKPSGELSASTLGAFLVSTNVKIAVLGIVLVGGSILAWRARAPLELPPVEARSAAPNDSAALSGSTTPSTPELAPAARAVERVAVAPAKAPDTRAVEVPLQAKNRLRGRVLDLQSRPVGGVRVVFESRGGGVAASELATSSDETDPNAPSTVSDGQGRFELEAPHASGQLIVFEERFATVLSGICSPGAAKSEPVIVVAERLRLAGRVVDESGRPLAAARVGISLPAHFRTSFADILDYSSERGWTTQSDEQGRFEFSRAPLIPNAKLQARLEGYLGHVQVAPEVSDASIVITLERLHAAKGVLSGQVLDVHGALVAEARVALGRETTRTDENGTFTLKLPEKAARATLMAVKRGHLPATQEIDTAAESSEFVVLRMGPPPLSIAGKVVDEDGRPQPGMKVWATDPTVFGRVDEVPAHVESLLAGSATRADIERLLASAGEDVNPRELLQDTPTVMWNFVKTDADGRFKLEGLLDRPYELAAMDPATLLRIRSGAVSAGNENVVITIPEGTVHERVAGRIVSRGGKPLAGISVAPMCDVMRVRSDDGQSTFHSQAKSVLTDEQGRFEFLKFPRQEVYLRLDGENILPVEIGRDEPLGIESVIKTKLDEIELVVATRIHVQVELKPEDAGSADGLRILDAEGQVMPINVFMGNSRNTTDESPIANGRSDVMVVTDDAATLVLLKEGEEVTRLALALTPDQLNVVRP